MLVGRQSWSCSGVVGLSWCLAAVCPAGSRVLTSHGPQGSHHGFSYSSLTRCTLCVPDFRTVVGHLENSPDLSARHRRNKVSRHESQGLLPHVGPAVWATHSSRSQQLTAVLHMSCLCHGSQHLSHDINRIWRHGSGIGTQKSRLHLDLGERGVEGAVTLICTLES